MDTLKRISVEEKFKKNPELKQADLEHIKDWYRKQPHFPKYINDSDLITFLHSNYYRIEATKATLEKYFTYRTNMPESFSKRDPLGSKTMRQTMKTLLIIPLERTSDNCDVFYGRLLNCDSDKFLYYNIIRLVCMIIDLHSFSTATVSGHIFVIDVQDMQMSHALRIPPIGLKKFLYYLQEAAPLRIKAFHFLNTNSTMTFIMGLMKPFFKKEFMNMIHMHQNTKSLFKYVPIDIFPNEVGGKAGPMMDMYNKVLHEIDENRDYFIEEESVMRITETNRSGKPKN